MLNVYKNSVCFYFWGVWQGQIYFTISDFYMIKWWEPGMNWEWWYSRQSAKNKIIHSQFNDIQTVEKCLLYIKTLKTTLKHFFYGREKLLFEIKSIFKTKIPMILC